MDYSDIYILYTNGSSSIVTIFFNSTLRNLQILSLYTLARQMDTYELFIEFLKERYTSTNNIFHIFCLNIIATWRYRNM